MQTKYIEERLSKQMEYYHHKSVALRNEYYRLSGIAIVINALIPVLTMAVETTSFLKYIIALLSAVSSISSSFLLLRKTKDSWIEYRSTYEQLKREKILFETSSGKYKTATEEDFILNCEDIMGAEHVVWKNMNTKETKGKE